MTGAGLSKNKTAVLCLNHSPEPASANILVFPLRLDQMPRRRFQMPSVERRRGKRDYYRIRYGVYLYIKGAEVRKQKSKFLGYCHTTNDLEMRKYRGEVTKRQAERIAAKFMDGINGAAAVTIGSQVRLRDFAARWVEDHVSQLKAPTRKVYGWALDKHILPELGDKQLGDVTTEIVQQWLNRKKFSWQSKTSLRSCLRVIFERAIDWHYWEGSNPVERVRVGTKRTVFEHRLLTDDEADRLIAELPGEMQILVAVLRATGFRISEAMALDWAQLDLRQEQGWVKVQQRSYQGMIDTVKSGAWREIPLGPNLTARLKAIAQPAGRVFSVSERQARHQLVWAARRAKLSFRGFGFHSFRREAGTVLQEHGASSIEAALWLGHTKPSMTQRYTLMQRERMKTLAREIEGGAKVVEIREVG